MWTNTLTLLLNCRLTTHFLLAIGLIAAAFNASATSISAVDSFSLASNPNGSWSYLAGSTSLPTAVVGAGSLSGLDYWWSGQNTPNSDIVGKNITNHTLSFETINLPVSYLLLDPESQHSVDVIFKAPTAGSYNISGSFLRIDTSEQSHPVDILLNGATIFSGTIGSYGQSDPFNLTRTLSAGSVIDFQSDTGSSFSYLSTGLAANLTSTPEPSTVGIAGLGCVLVALAVKRARRGAKASLEH